MKARDVMTPEIISVAPETPVKEIAETMIKYRISGVLVLDPKGAVVGLVTEGDLLRRPEIGAEDRRGSSLLSLFEHPDRRPTEYARSHGHRAEDIMTRDVISVDEETSVAEIARLLERRHIKRVPVLRKGRAVGIVSRANLVQALAAVSARSPEPPKEDRKLRDRIMEAFSDAGIDARFLNVIAHEGKVEVWGTVRSEAQLKAVQVAVEDVVPAERVESHVTILPESLRVGLWAD